MVKRKRGQESHGENGDATTSHTIQQNVKHRTGKNSENGAIGEKNFSEVTVIIQIVLGTYEKVLHGVTATILQDADVSTSHPYRIDFTDSFLFNAHEAAVRCLALSPQAPDGNSKKIFLATGSSDQVVNLYQLSTRQVAVAKPPPRDPLPVSLAGYHVSQNPNNRELGSLQHHAGGISKLHFPTRSKLMSGAEDCTVAITRTRDWAMLSTIKTPVPKVHGRPSGDTAPLGGTPAGVNDFAVHPSMKLMVSVSKAERCMRLWNLVTGRKAGVLNYDKDALQKIGEGKWASGEGRKVRWDTLGEEFVIAFEKGCIIYGLDSKIKLLVVPTPATKIHQLLYITLDEDPENTKEILAVSTEDGRIIFYDTKAETDHEKDETTDGAHTLVVKPIGQLGGKAEGLLGRIKDFTILRSPKSKGFHIVTAGSDGAVRIWNIQMNVMHSLVMGHNVSQKHRNGQPMGQMNDGVVNPVEVPQIGQLLGTYEAGNRITCLAAFEMGIEEEEESVEKHGVR